MPFIGIGNMGLPMAANLVHAGFHVAVIDVTPHRAVKFAVEIGGRAASGAADAARDADAVVTILPISKHVAEIVSAVLPSLAPGALVVEMSSGVPSITRDLARQVAAAGAAMIDCPVSGGVPRAKTGELVTLAGGKPDQIDRATPTPFAALCREMWASAAAMLGPGQDHTAVAQLSEKLAGTAVGGYNRAAE